MTTPGRFVLGGLDVGIVLVSLLAVVIVGLWAGRRSARSARAYFLASDKLPWWVVGSAFVSTSVSSEQIVGTVGYAYAHGMGIANWEWWSLPTYSLLILFFIPVYLHTRVATVPELLTKRYGPLCGDFYSVVMLAAYVLLFQVTVLYSGALAVSQLTGWSFSATLWVMVVLVGLYTVKGGLASVMWTDAVQCVMLIGGGLVLFFVALANIPGGWAAMEQARPERFHLYFPPEDPHAPFAGLIASSVGVALFYQAGNQYMIQRILAARSPWDGVMGVVFAGLINLVRPLVTCFLGFIVFHWIHVLGRAPALPDKDHAFTFALGAFATMGGLRGVVVAGFLAAVMSTVSALANSTATIFSMDVYKRWIRRDADDARLVSVGRGASLLSLVLAALVCPAVGQLGGIFQYFQTGVTYLQTPFISVLLLGILWRRTNYAGALFGLVGGLVIQIAVALTVSLAGLRLHWFYVAFIAQALTMAGVIAVSLATRPPDGSSGPYVWRPALLTLYGGGGRPWYRSLKLWFGIYATAWILLYARFW